MSMDTLWTRRTNNKLTLSTSTPAIPSSTAQSTTLHNDHPTRNYTPGKRYGDSSSHGGKANPFNSIPLASPAIQSPTVGASSAFGLGSGAFASFGAAGKTPKTPGTGGGSLDFGSVVAGTKMSGGEIGKENGNGNGNGKGKEKEGGVSRPQTATAQPSCTKSGPVTPQHPLKHTWVLWFRPPLAKSSGYLDYSKTVHPLASFSSLEDFFTVYSHLKRPSSLPLVSDYHVFRKGIRPVWEDEENRKGGKWVVRLKKGVADRYWEDLVFAVIGEAFADSPDEVCGVVLSVRNGEDILSIWTKNDGGRVLKIREIMKRVLAFPPETKVEWKSHDSSIAQRTAIDDARKEKGAESKRNGTGNGTGNGSIKEGEDEGKSERPERPERLKRSTTGL